MNGPQQGAPAKVYTAQEIDVLAKQAGELEQLNIQQMNKQIALKMIDKPPISDACASVMIEQAEDRCRLVVTQNNERVELEERHMAARFGMTKRHSLSLKMVDGPPATS